MFDGTPITILVMDVVDGNSPFNYFFTLICAFGLFSFFVGMVVKIISRS